MASVRASELGLNFAHWRFAYARANPIGLRLDLVFSPDRVETRFTPRREHEGYDGMTHGGILAALLDETMGWSALHQGTWGVTTRLAMTVRRPVAVDEEVRAVGEVLRDRGRARELRGEIRRAVDDHLLATAEATYVKMSQAQKQPLIAKYGDPTAALERSASLVKGQQ